MAVAVPQDDWTPARLKTQQEWRKRMYAPPPKVDPLAKKIQAAVADPDRAAMDARMAAMEQMISDLRDELTKARRKIARSKEPMEDVVSINLEHIIRVVAKYFGFSQRDLKSARRTTALCRARHIAMYLCKELTLRSFPEIARHLGGRDHSTAFHGVRKMEAKRLTDAVLCQDIAELEAMFG